MPRGAPSTPLSSGAREVRDPEPRQPGFRDDTWEFPKIGGTFFGVRILLFRVRNKGPLFSETPMWVVL